MKTVFRKDLEKDIKANRSKKPIGEMSNGEISTYLLASNRGVLTAILIAWALGAIIGYKL